MTRPTPEERAAIRERCDKATAGPWDAKNWRIFYWIGKCVGVICDTANNKATRTKQNSDNAEFIAHARTDVPTLLDALDDAERENAELKLQLYSGLSADRSCCSHGFVPITPAGYESALATARESGHREGMAAAAAKMCNSLVKETGSEMSAAWLWKAENEIRKAAK